MSSAHRAEGVVRLVKSTPVCAGVNWTVNSTDSAGCDGRPGSRSGLPPTMAGVVNAAFFGPIDLPLMLLLRGLAYIAVKFMSYSKGN